MAPSIVPQPAGATTRVVNLLDESYDVYIGRGRSSLYGNPFKIGHPIRDVSDNWHPATRDEVIAEYETLLDKILAADPDFLEPLRGKVLGCYCKPLACHGDVIVRKLEE